jgi:MFS family permease
LWIARVLSHVGDGVALVALVLYVERTERTGTAVGALLLAFTLPSLIGPLAGALTDRFDHRRLMIGCELGQALVFIVMSAWLPTLPLMLALVAVTSVLARLFAPAGRSIVPSLVPNRDLSRANAWTGMALNLQVAIGPALGGAVTAALGTRAALVVNAATFVASAAFLSRLPRVQPTASSSPEGFGRSTGTGISFSLRHPVTRAVILGLFFGVAFAAVDDVALVFLARRELHIEAAGYGVIAASFGVGMILAVAPIMRWGTSNSKRVFLLGLVATAAGSLATGAAPNLVAGVMAQALAGGGNGLTNVATDTLVQQTVPASHLGRAFGAVSTAAFLGGAIARGLGGPLLDLTSPRTVFVIGGLGVLVTLLAVAPLLPSTKNRAA